MTALSTHVLDLSIGRPGADIGVRLHSRASDPPDLIFETRTDADGRARLIAPGELKPGRYRLAFDIGAYFTRTGATAEDPPFLDVVMIDFTVTDAARHHHVPLLVSPFGYSTYRGS